MMFPQKNITRDHGMVTVPKRVPMEKPSPPPKQPDSEAKESSKSVWESFNIESKI